MATCRIPTQLILIQEECECIIALINLGTCTPQDMECAVCLYSTGYIKRHLKECLEIINDVIINDESYRKAGDKYFKIDNAE